MENTEAKTDIAKPLTPRPTRAIAIAIGMTLALTAIDLGTKFWAEDNLSETRENAGPVCDTDEHGRYQYQRRRTDPVVLSEGLLELRYAENCGAAFSLLATASPIVKHSIFGLAAIIACFALFWHFAKGTGGRMYAWAVPLIVSGAIGNLADRFRLGYVVDFIRVYWEGTILGLSEWPTFNVADITIFVGAALLLLEGFFPEPEESKPDADSASGDEPSAAAA